jgi:hypothetical protein
MSSPIVQLPLVSINPLKPSTGPLSTQSGVGVLSQVALLSQQITDPQQLAMIVYEAIQGLQDQIRSINQILGLTPTINTVNIPDLHSQANGTAGVSAIWTDNDPVAGSISWKSAAVNFQGTTYQVADGSTGATNFFVYWLIGTPNVFSVSAGYPALGDSQFLIATNDHDATGAAGRVSLVDELHVRTGDKTTARDSEAFYVYGGSSGDFNIAARLRCSVANGGGAGQGCPGVLELYDATGAGSLGGGAKIIATGVDGKVQMATFEVNVANSPTSLVPNFKSMTVASATAGTNGDVPAQVVGYLKVQVDGSNARIPYYNV